MLASLAVLLLALTGCCAADGSNWAVLVAGSNGYSNYRHQADIAHAYQILAKRGEFPPKNVIVMMYNDVVDSPSNPLRGHLYNKPAGPDVYQGIQIDYEKGDVTATNFLNVLQGIEHAGGKPVLQSTKDDNVFVYFADHGAPGMIAMPTGDPLYADQLHSALKYMHEHEMYHQLVFYIEACESGSMFEGLLPNNMSIYATTAANPDESSYATYWNDTLQTFMGDEYSVAWMEDSDENWGTEETLHTQFEDVKQHVNQSHPQEYGNSGIAQEDLTDFQGYDDWSSRVHSGERRRSRRTAYWGVDSRDVQLHTLQQMVRLASNDEAQRAAESELAVEVALRAHADELFAEIALMTAHMANEDVLALTAGRRDFDCLRAAYSAYEDRCGVWNDYSMKYVRTLANLCDLHGEREVTRAVGLAC